MNRAVAGIAPAPTDPAPISVPAVAMARADWLGCVRHRWPDGRLNPLAQALAGQATGVDLTVKLEQPTVFEILHAANLVPAAVAAAPGPRSSTHAPNRPR